MRGKKSAVGLLGSLSLLGWLGLMGPLVFVKEAAERRSLTVFSGRWPQRVP